MNLPAHDLTVKLDMDGTINLTIKVDKTHRLVVQEVINELSGKQLSIDLKKWREKRSLDANAYCWVLIDKIAKKMKLGKTEVYRRYIKDVPGASQIVCVPSSAVDKLTDGWQHNGLGWVTDTVESKVPGCTNVLLYYGSSAYDTKQMGALIDLIIQDCKALGIDTLTPIELDRMKEGWHDKKYNAG